MGIIAEVTFGITFLQQIGMLLACCLFWFIMANRYEKRCKESFKTDGIRDFPGGPVAKTLHSQCRGPRFNPSSGN